MENQSAASARPVIQLREKRKFNWLVLTLLLAIVVVGAASFLL